MRTLKERLTAWTDFDGACFELGILLGMWPDGHESFQAQKHVFWTRNPVGEALMNALLALARPGEGPIEEHDEGCRFRWRQTAPVDEGAPPT